MLKNSLIHLFSNAWIIISVSANSVHVSHPYRRMKTTSDLYNLYFVWKLIFLLHILANLAMAAAIRVWISKLQVPSLDKIAPKYLKLEFPFINFDTDVTICIIDHYFGLLRADPYSICSCSLKKFIGQVLELTVTTCYWVNVICKM